MRDPLILAIDVGTQSVRAIAFDPTGALVAASKVDIEPYFAAQPGWAEQEPTYYWEKLGEACPIVTVWGSGYKVGAEVHAA